MPRPKYRPPAALAPLPILAPGFRGLNTELSSTVGLVDPMWALGLSDWVFDDAGKLSSRKGYTRKSDDPSFGEADVKRLHEYIADDGTKRLIGVSFDAAVATFNVTLGNESVVTGYAHDDILFVGAVGSVSSAAVGIHTLKGLYYNDASENPTWELVLDNDSSEPARGFIESITIEHADGETITLQEADATFNAPSLVGGGTNPVQWQWDGTDAQGWLAAEAAEVRAVTINLGNTVTLWASEDDGATWSDITGSVSSETPSWKFVNFGDKVIGAAPGHKLISYDGSGNFAEITATSGTVPTSNGGVLAAFGRLWVINDATGIVSYSGLLNETQWDSGGAGQLDTSNVWTQNDSRPVGLAVLGAVFVIFGRGEILLYADGSGSEVGINPDSMYVVDTIEGTGLMSRDGVLSIGEGDLWFLSAEGVQSLKRVIQDKVNPLVAITRNVKRAVQKYIAASPEIDYAVTALYSPEHHFVLYCFPDSGEMLCIDTRLELEDGSRRVITWNLDANAVYRRQDGTILFAMDGGYVGEYTGYRDDGSTVIVPKYTSPWLDWGEEAHNRLKVLTEAYAILFGIDTLTCKLRWAFDYRPLEHSQDFTSEYTQSGAEWGSGEFGEDEFGDGLRHRKEYVGMGGEGQYVKVFLSVESTDTDAKVSLQELTLFAKPGIVL